MSFSIDSNPSPSPSSSSSSPSPQSDVSASASMSTFSGMMTNEDLSSETIAMMENDEDDCIIQELPIVLSQQLAQTLYLMQSPLRPPHRPYDSELGERVSLKVKPIQKKVEMEFRLEDAGTNYNSNFVSGDSGVSEGVGNNHDKNHVYPISKLTLVAKSVAPKTNYCAGVLSNGVLHLTPIHASCRFKPSLSYIDAAELAAAAESEAKKEEHRNERMREGRMTEEEELEMEEEEYQKEKEEENKKELQTVIMKVKRKDYGNNNSAANAALGGLMQSGGGFRKQTYAFLKQLEEREEWITLKIHEQESPVCNSQFSRLLSCAPSSSTLPSSSSILSSSSSTLPPPIQFNVPAERYLGWVNPPDVFESNSSQQSLNATGDSLYLTFEERLLYFMRNCRVCLLSELCLKMGIIDEEQLETALSFLCQMCWVVQGCLVLKSSIVYDRKWKPGMIVASAIQAPNTEGINPNQFQSQRGKGGMGGNGIAERVQLCREFILTQFHSQRNIYRDELMTLLQLELEPLDELLNELAVKKPLEINQIKQQGIPRGAQWEWKIKTDHSIKQFFPRFVAITDQALPEMANTLRPLLFTTSVHPGRVDTSTRGLSLDYTPHIVHALSPAGLTTDRETAEKYIHKTKQEDSKKSNKNSKQYQQGDPMALPIHSQIAASSSSSSSSSTPLSQCLQTFRSHLRQLFVTHSILQSSFIQHECDILLPQLQQQQQQLQSSSSSNDNLISNQHLQQVLEEEATAFGPENKWFMEIKKGNTQHRQLVASLFANSNSVSTSTLRSALPKSITEEKRKELMKEFSNYNAATQSWQLKSS